MDGISCDRCSKSLLVDEPLRYIAEVRVFAAYDVLELAPGEAAADPRAEIERLIRDIEGRDPAAIEDEVARVFKFDLCPTCQKDFLRETRAWFGGTSR